MNDLRLIILKWPDKLNHILDCLESTTHQEFRDTRMDDGSVKRALISSPMPLFKGQVSLSYGEKTVLDVFFEESAGRHFMFQYPPTGKTVYATFMKQPFIREQKLVVGANSSYIIEILLKETTGTIEKALKEGIMSHA